MHQCGITDLKRGEKEQKEKNLLLCFGWSSKQQQVFTHALFTKENGARAQTSMCARGTAKFLAIVLD